MPSKILLTRSVAAAAVCLCPSAALAQAAVARTTLEGGLRAASGPLGNFRPGGTWVEPEVVHRQRDPRKVGDRD